jgi:hypothetical protein
MVTTAPEAIEKPPVKDRAGADGRNPTKVAENNGSAEPGSPARRGKRRRNARGNESPSSVQRFFLTKDSTRPSRDLAWNNGIPELDHEVEDENTAMVEALKTGGTYIMLSEWRPTVDNSTKGRPVVTKEAVSKGK